MFHLYLFDYSESLLPILRIVAILSASRGSFRVELRRIISYARTNEWCVVEGIARRYRIEALNKSQHATLLSFENLVCRRPVLLIVVM